jgi:lipoprotein-anchoring transpeptidase ErfK/SrfK
VGQMRGVLARSTRHSARRRRLRVGASLLAMFLVTACSATHTGSGAKDGPTRASSPTASPSSSPRAHGAPVHVSLLESDGATYGVGMPIIAYFTRKITDPTAFEQAVRVTVNGKAAAGAWYWEHTGRSGQALEAHYRLPQYWPAHASVVVDLPVKGLSAGPGLVYDDSLTLSIRTGPANVSSVDCAAEKMTVTSDGSTVRTMPTSCGKASTPTYWGTKVLMQKGEDLPGTDKRRPDGAVRMKSNNPADPYNLIVPWSVRITNSGEYVHSASWNGGNIGVRSTSNGCTNLNVNDAKWFYTFSQIGDVVNYSNTGGKRMPSWDGYGDWNLPWATWQAGGVASPSGR